jgi:signal transduction histidine kinase
MHRILIVDDNPIIRKGLIKMINWNALNAELAGEAENGEKAVELIKALEPDSNNSGGILTLHDVTALKKLEQMRTEFVSNVTHELKTPLTSIRGFVETLKNGAIEDPDVAFKLAITGAINDDVYDWEKVIFSLLVLLKENYGERLMERYKIDIPLSVDERNLLELIGSKRGCLRSGGIIDYEKAGKIVLQEFRAGKLGRFTLDKPQNMDEYN